MRFPLISCGLAMLLSVATWLSAWTGVPAGVFAPSLAIGAGIGHEVASFTGITREERAALGAWVEQGARVQ